MAHKEVQMSLANGTRVLYQPRSHEEQSCAGHQGTVIYHTIDGFFRVQWDYPNPNPDLFNLGMVFTPDRLVKVEE